MSNPELQPLIDRALQLARERTVECQCTASDYARDVDRTIGCPEACPGTSTIPDPRFAKLVKVLEWPFPRKRDTESDALRWVNGSWSDLPEGALEGALERAMPEGFWLNRGRNSVGHWAEIGPHSLVITPTMVGYQFNSATACLKAIIKWLETMK